MMTSDDSADLLRQHGVQVTAQRSGTGVLVCWPSKAVEGDAIEFSEHVDVALVADAMQALSGKDEFQLGEIKSYPGLGQGKGKENTMRARGWIKLEEKEVA